MSTYADREDHLRRHVVQIAEEESPDDTGLEWPLLPEPAEPRDRDEWPYGMRKRAAEDALAAAWDRARFPATRLRIPMV